MSPAHAFLIVAGAILALTIVGAAVAHRLLRRVDKRRGGIAEHTTEFWS